jgi:glycosyl-4,4'-diaponeurosporenoate acyltransferase
MKIIKKILFPFFSAFLLYKSYELIKTLMASLPSNFSIIEIIFISFLICLFITGVFAFIGFAYPTNKILSLKYYKLKNPKNLVRIYKILKVDYFNKILLILFWGRRKNRLKYFNGTRSGIDNFIYQSKQSEFGHLGAFVLVLITSIIISLKGHIIMAIIINLINIIGNLYPIILQRHHRVRIDKLTKHNKERS